MEILLIVAGVAILVALVVVVMNNRWRTIVTAKGNMAEEVERKRAYLRDQGVKCRVRTENAAGPAGFAAGLGGELPSTAVVKLDVKPSDRAKAMQLLEQYDREQRQEMTLSL